MSTMVRGSSGPLLEVGGRLKSAWGWILFLGIVTMMAGFFAIVAPWSASLATSLLVSWVLVFTGITRSVHAFHTRHERGFWSAFLVGLATFALGAFLLFFPLKGMLTLTLLVGWYLLFEGIVRISWAFQLRPLDGWVWVLALGILSGLGGLLIIGGLPETAVWVIGTIIGVDLVLSGWQMIFFASAARRLGRSFVR